MAKLSLAAAKASRSWRSPWADTVHPDEIGLGHLGELLQGDIPGHGQRLPSWPGQASSAGPGLAGLLPGHAATKPARRDSELPR